MTNSTLESLLVAERKQVQVRLSEDLVEEIDTLTEQLRGLPRYRGFTINRSVTIRLALTGGGLAALHDEVKQHRKRGRK